jgi:hypothetical protein
LKLASVDFVEELEVPLSPFRDPAVIGIKGLLSGNRPLKPSKQASGSERQTGRCIDRTGSMQHAIGFPLG